MTDFTPQWELLGDLRPVRLVEPDDPIELIAAIEASARRPADEFTRSINSPRADQYAAQILSAYGLEI